MKISVITASYNYARYIEETIESVLNQTYSDWELIIIDDGSVDNSIDIINNYVEKDERIKFFTHENNQNKGLKETLLLGLEKAEGEYVAFLESDDVWDINYLAEKVTVINEYPHVAMIFNDCEFFGEEERIKVLNCMLRGSRNWLRRQKFPENISRHMFLGNKIFTFSAALCKKSEFLKLDFNTPEDKVLDWWLWIQLAYNNDFYYIDKPLTKWRLHKGSYIQKGKKRSPYILPQKAYMFLYKKYNDKSILLFLMRMNLYKYARIMNGKVRLLIHKIREKFTGSPC